MTKEEVRDEIREDILKLNNPNILLEIATGVGKTRTSLEIMQKLYTDVSKIQNGILIVVYRLVLIPEWKKEIAKWGYTEYLPHIQFVTYKSLEKKAGNWDFVIFDECHHLSDRCIDCLTSFNIKNSVLLSATVKRNHKAILLQTFKDLGVYKVSSKEAINANILPDPKVYLIPLFLNNRASSFRIIRNKGKGNPLNINYKDRFKYAKIKNRQLIIECTQRQYYDDMSSLIEWHRKRGGNVHQRIYLHLCGERLRWLSNQKTTLVKTILNQLKEERTLTFCNSITQTEELGTFCINSKNKESQQNLEDFNNGRCDHITACNMLDEGEMTPQFF